MPEMTSVVTYVEVDAAYRRSGNELGWRLLASPKSVLAGARTAFIGLNPGGNHEPPEHPRFAPDFGSAYATESWAGAPPGESRLQIRVLALFKALNERPELVLAGNLVPFRSPTFKDLRNKQAALKFGQDLWLRILRSAQPSLIITMAREVERSLSSVLGARIEAKERLGWGNVTGRRWRFESGALAALPHLSRYGVVTREASQAGLAKLFAARWKA